MPENKDLLLEEGAQQPFTPPNGKTHLLVIAIDEYAHCPRLNNCVKDAKEFIEILDTRYGIAIDAALPPLFNGDATKKNIIYSFRKLAEKAAPQDNVLIYFSGHGEYDKVLKQGYWVPVEAQKGGIDTYLPNSEVRTFLEAVNSHHTFMVVDSCFSGALFLDKSVDKNVVRLESHPSRWGLTSGRNEIVSDGEAGRNSPFAESLLYHLGHNPGDLGVMQLCTLVLEQVVANAIQSPRGEPLQVKGHKGGQFVFKPKKEDEDRLWAEALKSNSIAAYNAFLARFPTGIHAATARHLLKELEEEGHWEAAQASNNIHRWLDFLDKYPQSRYRKEAGEKIKSLEDLQDWETARQGGKISDFLKYKYSHPEGRYVKEADQRIAELREAHEEADAWRKAQNEHTQRSYQRYLDDYPNGPNASKASAEREALREKENANDAQRKEDEAWSAAKRKDEIPAYEHYLQAYPNGSYRREAEERVAALKQQPDVPKPTPPEENDVLVLPQEKRTGLPQWLPFGLGALILAIGLFAGMKTGIFGTGRELEIYKTAMAAQTIPAMENYLRKYPEGEYADTVKLRLESLNQKLDNYLKDAGNMIELGLFGDAKDFLDKAKKLNPKDPRIESLMEKTR